MSGEKELRLRQRIMTFKEKERRAARPRGPRNALHDET